MADHLLHVASRVALLCASGLLLAPTSGYGQVPVTIVLSTPTTLCAQEVTGQVTLSAPAPAAGLAVQLTSSMPAVVAAPPSVTVPAGATSASLRLPRCTPTPQALAVTIGATANGTTQSTILNVLAPTLKSIVLKTNNTSPISFTGAATLQGPAPAGGVVVALTNSQPALVATPTTATIPAGANSANFTMTATSAVSQPTTFTVTGSGLGAAVSTNSILPSATPVSLLFASGSTATAALTMTSGRNATARVTLNGRAGPDGLSIKLASSDPAIATVPDVAVVPAGDSMAQFTVTTVGQPRTASVTIVARVGTTTASGTLTVTGTTLASLSVSPNPVIAGLTAQGRVASSQAAGPGGFIVRFTSSNSDLVRLPAIVTIPEGASSATFPVTTLYTDAVRTIAISATGGGASKSESVMLTPEGISVFTIKPLRVIGGTTVTGRLSAPFGHDGFTVALVSATPDVATVPATVTFTAQDTVKTFPITTNPLRVSATARFTASVRSKSNAGSVNPSRTAEVDVVPPTIRSLTMTPSRVIGGSSAVFTGTVTLTGPAPLGMGVALTSTNTAIGVPTNISFVAGATTATFTARTLAVTANTDVSVRAKIGDELGGASTTVRVTVRP